MTITLTLSTDGPSKRSIIELAFGDIALAGYEFGRTPEEVTDALLRLNALMLEWPFSGLGYVQPEYGSGEPDDLSGIPFATLNTVAAALAERLAPMMGAALSTEAKSNLVRGMAVLRAQYATVPTMPIQANTPRGAGARTRIGPFINELAEDVNPVEEA